MRDLLSKILLRPFEAFFVALGDFIEIVDGGITRLYRAYCRAIKAVDNPMTRLFLVYLVLWIIVFLV